MGDWEKEDVEQMGTIISVTMPFLMQIKVEMLKDAVQDMKVRVSQYEVLGGVRDGSIMYQKKLGDKIARLKRLQALLALVVVSNETAPDILEGGV